MDMQTDIYTCMHDLMQAKASTGVRVPISEQDLTTRIMEAKFTLSDTVTVHFDLPASHHPYIILPATYSPGMPRLSGK
jgi:hypothetical protein